MFDAQVISRFRKIRALAIQGEGGEQATAARKLTELERQHPGLSAHVTRLDLDGIRSNPPVPEEAPPQSIWETVTQGLRGAASLLTGVQAVGMESAQDDYGIHLTLHVPYAVADQLIGRGSESAGLLLGSRVRAELIRLRTTSRS